MELRELSIEKRTEIGKGASGRARKNGLIPAIIYRRGEEGASVLLTDREFRKVAEKSRTSQVFTFKSEDKDLNGKKGIIKGVQQHYLKGIIEHVDFQQIEEDDVVKVRVPIEVHGVPFGVKNQGGVITVAGREVILKCTSANIPNMIKVNVSDLKLGERVRTGDVKLPEGAVLAGNPEETVASIVSGRAARIQAAQEKAPEGEKAAPAKA